jgi:hypothetical protein
MSCTCKIKETIIPLDVTKVSFVFCLHRHNVSNKFVIIMNYYRLPYTTSNLPVIRLISVSGIRPDIRQVKSGIRPNTGSLKRLDIWYNPNSVLMFFLCPAELHTIANISMRIFPISLSFLVSGILFFLISLGQVRIHNIPHTMCKWVFWALFNHFRGRFRGDRDLFGP